MGAAPMRSGYCIACGRPLRSPPHHDVLLREEVTHVCAACQPLTAARVEGRHKLAQLQWTAWCAVFDMKPDEVAAVALVRREGEVGAGGTAVYDEIPLDAADVAFMDNVGALPEKCRRASPA